MRHYGKVGAALVAGAAIALLLTVARAQDDRIQFPDVYTTYSIFLSIDKLFPSPNDGQIMRIFANYIAMQGPGEDGRLADGAVIVGEIYAAVKDADGNVILSELGRRIRGNFVDIAVMEKQDGWGELFTDEFRNDDWDFALFGPDGARRDIDLNSCRACHAPLDARDHVFSFEHLPIPAM